MALNLRDVIFRKHAAEDVPEVNGGVDGALDFQPAVIAHESVWRPAYHRVQRVLDEADLFYLTVHDLRVEGAGRILVVEAPLFGRGRPLLPALPGEDLGRQAQHVRPGRPGQFPGLPGFL